MSLTSSAEQPQSLSRVVLAVKDWVGRCGEIWVEAQVVEIKRRNAPTQFLTFRDLHTDISADVTTSSMVLDAAGPLPEGSTVAARVRPRVWERSARLSFECLELRVAGEGRLLAQLEQLKRKLQAEGLFDTYRKRPLPFLPHRIGLITGKDSDAERDVTVNVARRWPNAQLRIEHALVQGPQSAASVMTALRTLDDDPEVDVIIIARGGGSLEDLLSFSDEGLVRAVAAAQTPIVTAIGHERDVPIVDLVADVRASTPTDAAKRVVPDYATELSLLTEQRSRLLAAIHRTIADAQQHLDQLRTRPVMVNPTSAFTAHYDKLALLQHQLNSAIERTLHREEATLRDAVSTVRALSPKKTLERGYAVLVDEHNEAVTSIHHAPPGSLLQAYLHDGQLTLTVTENETKDSDGQD